MGAMIRKILVVDDSPVARRILLSCIPKDRGYEFYEAADGMEGLKVFTEVGPDVTFLDITMPVMDGIQCLEQIKSLNADAVVVMCTADIQPKSIARAGSLGALTLVRKPPSRDIVLGALQEASDALGKIGN